MHRLILSALFSFCLLSPACGLRKPVSTPPDASPSPSPTASSSPGVKPLITAKIRPTLETNDVVVAEAQRLEQSGELSEVLVQESYPVQITATGTASAIQRLQKLAAGNSSNPDAISFETLSNRSSRLTSPQTIAVSDDTAWQELWRKHYGSDSDRPLIDFEHYTVLGVFAGQKRSGGYSIQITAVQLVARELVVSYREKSPAASDLVSQSLTSPAHLVSIKRSKLAGDFDSVRFEKEKS